MQAWEAPGQSPAQSGVTQLVTRAEGFWKTHGLTACPDGVSAWVAPHLVAEDGDAEERGDGETCEIWLSESVTDDMDNPDSLDTLIDACTTVTHGVGHAYGKPHAAKGVMSIMPYDWPPSFCLRWARSTYRAFLRGDGLSERAIRHTIETEMYYLLH